METPPESLPDTDVEALARAVPGWEHVPLAIEPVVGPGGGHRFRVEAAGEAFVLQLPSTGAASVGVGRDAGHEASRLAQAAGAGPPVYAYLEDRRCLVTRLVEGRRVPDDEFLRVGVMAAVVGSVRAIHACPPVASTFSVFPVVDEYRRPAQDANVLLDADHAWIVNYEHAGMGDPFFDLGTPCVEHGLSLTTGTCCCVSTSVPSAMPIGPV